VNLSDKGTYIIAEAGVNHNGSLDLALQMIDAAAAAGADAVKFQTFRAERMISRQAPKAEYQKRTTAGQESQLEMVRRLELDGRSHRVLLDHCVKRKVQFLSTPFDEESLTLLARTLNLPLLKVASGEITNGPFLLAVARTGKSVILSTGMSTLEEIALALGVLAFGYLGKRRMPSRESFAGVQRSEAGRRILREKVVLLQCTTEYPAPFSEVNLAAMATLRATFGLPVGLSDHTPGIVVPIAAVALGAGIVEKHFTMDRSLPGPDHQASLEPTELAAMVRSIRQIESAIGRPEKVPTTVEIKNRAVARRSLVAAVPIAKGDVYSPANLTTKRPGTGISPMSYWEILGHKAGRAYEQDELIVP